MHTLLTVALLLALLFDTAAATNPAIGPILPAVPMEFPYPDPEGILSAICDLCGISLDYCVHTVTQLPQPLFTEDITEDTFYSHPEWPQASPFAVTDDSESEFQPPIQYFAHDADTQSLNDWNIEQLNDQLDENATTVQPRTIQHHIDGTYTPGDRLQPPARSRQASRPGGFGCSFRGCAKRYNRACDVKRHGKTHLDRSERPHKCTLCDEGFLYPKDLARHQNKHTTAQGNLFCDVLGCMSEPFSRRDNLLRHKRKQHPPSTAGS
ncbi:hypothetical protein P280DRAFT_139877 [Massarina eburnea CBS 473.64]|uniref:C2H2-type domain-containing protein n=1 Tax=Massarina eburnea CBS 473.64 TaxID=1395130 RepID=A0A6A6RQN3_9PLEO|nr:hypothetical protein P280DRAFT_139877 [Massarina eburnea CBS 473.64]